MKHCHCQCRNPQNGLKMCYHPKLLEMLRYISTLFKKHDIPFWLDKGTLLGAARDNKMIPWDNDIDIGVWLSDYKRILDLAPIALEEEGYSLEPSISGTPTQINLRYSPVCIWTMCIDGWQIEGDEAVIPQYPRYRCPKEYVQNLDKIIFEGVEYPCPQHPEICLTNFYRENWKVPQVLSLCKGIVNYFRTSNKDVVEEMKKWGYYD